MSLVTWLVLALLALLLLAHRLVCRLLPRYALQRLRRRVECALPQSAVRQLLPPPLSLLLPPSLLSSPLLVALTLSAGSSMQLHWPISSGLRYLTLVVHQPHFEASLAAATSPSAQPGERKVAHGNGNGIGTPAGEEASSSGGSSGRSGESTKRRQSPVSISSFQAVLLRWFHVTVVIRDARGHISAVSRTPTPQLCATPSSLHFASPSPLIVWPCAVLSVVVEWSCARAAGASIAYRLSLAGAEHWGRSGVRPSHGRLYCPAHQAPAAASSHRLSVLIALQAARRVGSAASASHAGSAGAALSCRALPPSLDFVAAHSRSRALCLLPEPSGAGSRHQVGRSEGRGQAGRSLRSLRSHRPRSHGHRQPASHAEEREESLPLTAALGHRRCCPFVAHCSADHAQASRPHTPTPHRLLALCPASFSSDLSIVCVCV